MKEIVIPDRSTTLQKCMTAARSTQHRRRSEGSVSTLFAYVHF